MRFVCHEDGNISGKLRVQYLKIKLNVILYKTTPVPGVVGNIAVILGDSLVSGDLIAVITKQI